MLGFLLETLIANKALDVFYTSIMMKKNRPAYKLTVLCKEEDTKDIERLIFKHTTTIGIRKRKEERSVLNRSFDTIETKYGPLDVKIVELEDETRMYPEYESAKKLALQHNVSIKEVYNALNRDE